VTLRASLIIVSEPDGFERKQRNFFASLLAQRFAHDQFEVIIVDAHARPSTASALQAFRRDPAASPATLLRAPTQARAAGNNLAARRADGELLIFLADDFDPSPGFIDAHVAYHALNPDVDAVGIGAGLFTDEIRDGFFARWLEDSGRIFGVRMRAPVAVWPRSFFYAGNASIKRAKFESLGGFDERFPYDAWDDHEFGLRWAASGGYSQFVAGATATHRHVVRFDERCAAMVRAGESARVLEVIHPQLAHGWRAILRPDAASPRPEPAPDAPAHVRIAYYEQRLDAAFRRGYADALAAERRIDPAGTPAAAQRAPANVGG
jgi:glycosyltransferase involved in cell wall biosynthesis